MTAFTDNHIRLSSLVKLFSKSQSSNSCRIYGPSKIPTLILASLSLGNLFFKKKRSASPFLFNVLMQFSQCRALHAILVKRSFVDQPVIFE